MREKIMIDRKLRNEDERYFVIELKGYLVSNGGLECVFQHSKEEGKKIIEWLEEVQISYVGEVFLDVKREKEGNENNSLYSVSVSGHFAVPPFMDKNKVRFEAAKVSKRQQMSVKEVTNLHILRNEKEKKSAIVLPEEASLDSFLQETVDRYQLTTIRKEIDRALDEGNKEAFQRLSVEYVKLMRKMDKGQ